MHGSIQHVTTPPGGGGLHGVSIQLLTNVLISWKNLLAQKQSFKSLIVNEIHSQNHHPPLLRGIVNSSGLPSHSKQLLATWSSLAYQLLCTHCFRYLIPCKLLSVVFPFFLIHNLSWGSLIMGTLSTSKSCLQCSTQIYLRHSVHSSLMNDHPAYESEKKSENH